MSKATDLYINLSYWVPLRLYHQSQLTFSLQNIPNVYKNGLIAEFMGNTNIMMKAYTSLGILLPVNAIIPEIDWFENNYVTHFMLHLFKGWTMIYWMY